MSLLDFLKPKKRYPEPSFRPVVTHVIRIFKDKFKDKDVFFPVILQGESNIMNIEYESEKACRLALVALKNAFENGTFRVDVIDLAENSKVESAKADKSK